VAGQADASSASKYAGKTVHVNRTALTPVTSCAERHVDFEGHESSGVRAVAARRATVALSTIAKTGAVGPRPQGALWLNGSGTQWAVTADRTNDRYLDASQNAGIAVVSTGAEGAGGLLSCTVPSGKPVHQVAENGEIGTSGATETDGASSWTCVDEVDVGAGSTNVDLGAGLTEVVAARGVAASIDRSQRDAARAVEPSLARQWFASGHHVGHTGQRAVLTCLAGEAVAVACHTLNAVSVGSRRARNGVGRSISTVVAVGALTSDSAHETWIHGVVLLDGDTVQESAAGIRDAVATAVEAGAAWSSWLSQVLGQAVVARCARNAVGDVLTTGFWLVGTNWAGNR